MQSTTESDGSNRTKFEERVRSAQIEARARNISHNVRCLECGHQSIEESQADIAIKLRKVIRDELRNGRSDKEIYDQLTRNYGETILYTPAFDAQSAVLWLLPVVTVGVVAGVTLFRGRRQSADVGELTRSLLHGIPLSAEEHKSLSALVKPPFTSRSFNQKNWLQGLFRRF